MRKLIVTRGVSGVGKSTFIESYGLADYALSAVKLGLIQESPRLGTDGFLQYRIKPLSGRALQTLLDTARARLRRGDTTVIGAVMAEQETLEKFIELALDENADCAVLDFAFTEGAFAGPGTSKPPGADLAEVKAVVERNKERYGYPGHIPNPGIVLRQYQDIQLQRRLSRFSSNVTVIPVVPRVVEGEAVDKLGLFLATPKSTPTRALASPVTFLDPHQIKRVVTVGDIHGCLAHLKKAFPDGLNDPQTLMCLLATILTAALTVRAFWNGFGKMRLLLA